MKKILLLVFNVLVIAGSLSAQFPNANFLATDGQVNASVYDPATQKMYFAGDFSAVGNPNSSYFAAVNFAGKFIPNVIPTINGQVTKILRDGSFLYVVGNFTTVNGVAKPGIVRLIGVNQVDTTFNPAITVPDGYGITDIAINGNLIAIAGRFVSNQDNLLRRVALLDKNSGSIYSWTPNFSPYDGIVHDIEFNGSLLFIGGRFNLNSLPNLSGTIVRRAFAAFVINNPNSVILSSSFNFGLYNSNSAQPVVYTMAKLGNTMWVGGDFEGGNGFVSREIFAINLSTSGRISSFNAGLYAPSGNSSDAYVASIVFASYGIFVGGKFHTPSIGGISRQNFVFMDGSGSFSTAPQFDIVQGNSSAVIRNLSVIDWGTNNQRLFISGLFQTIPNSNRKTNGVLVYDFNPGNSAFSINMPLINGTPGPIITAYRESSGFYILGGSFPLAGGTRCPHLAVFNNTGNLDTSVTNSFFQNSYGGMSIKTMVLSGSSIYLGGKFNSTNSSSAGRNALMKISKSTLAIDNTFPQLDATVGNVVNSLLVDANSLYIGGGFSKYVLPNGVPVNKSNFFIWNLSSNSASSLPTNISGAVNAISSTPLFIFVGGAFPGLVKISKSSFVQLASIGTATHTSLSSVKVIGNNVFCADKNSIFVYNVLNNSLMGRFSLPTPATTLPSSILQVSNTHFTVGFNYNKLFYSQILIPNASLPINMTEDLRVGNYFKPFEYFSNLNLIVGHFANGGTRLKIKTWETVFESGKYTFASYNNSVAPPPSAAPTISASAINLIPGTTNVNVSWTSGNGNRRIVLARKDLDPLIPTTFPTSITANANFGSGTNVGSATFCVYDGIGSNVNVTNLQNLSNYRFSVIEYNLNGTVRTFKTTLIPTASCITLDYAAPTIAASSLQVSNITANSFRLTWVNGNGTGRMIILKQGLNSISFIPSPGITYFNSQTLNDGSSVINYNVSGNSLDLTGLTPGTSYSVSIIEYFSYSMVGPRYGATFPKINATTSNFASLPATQASNINVIPGITSANISWTRGSGGRSLVLITKFANSSPIVSTTSIPTINGRNYTGEPNLNNYSATSDLPYFNTRFESGQVVYHGTGNSVNVTNLTPGSVYSVAVFESNGGGFGGAGQVSYLNSPRPTISFSTNFLVIAPSANTNSHNVIVSQDEASISWSGGNGSNSLMVLKKDGPVSFNPLDDNFYSPNAIFGSGTNLGNLSYAVYASNSNGTVNVSNLDPDAEYHFAIYDYNTQGALAKYNPTPYRGIFRTSRAWPVRAGGAKKDAGGGVVVDASGNVYVAGTFENSGSWGTNTIQSFGGNDIFLTKYSPVGKPIWVLKQGGGDADAASSLTMDNSGNVIMTGSFRGNGTFGQGNLLTSNGIDDIFLSKVSPAGNVIWSKKVGGTDQEVAFSITTDDGGNIYISGYFRGTIVFPGSSFTMTSNGGTDALLAKFDGSGNLIWAKSGGGIGNDFAYGVTVKGSNVAIVGQFDGNANFDASNLISSGQSDIFIAEYNNTSGALNWINKFGGTGADIGFSITTAGTDYAITGQFSNTVTIGATTLNSSGNSDILIGRVNASGSPVWFKKAGGISQDAGRGITLNGAGDKLFVTGSFADVATFGANTFTTFGNLDIFVATVNLADGEIQNVYQNGGPSDDEARGITANSTNTSFITGYFNGQGSFGNADLSSAGDWDIFVHKFTLIVAPDLANGLVAWYKMNGNANDASGNGNNGVAQNLVSVADRSNDANKAYAFQLGSAVDVLKVDPVDVAGTATTTTSTYLAWLKTVPNFSSSNTPKPIFSTSFDDSEFRSIQLSDIGTITYTFFSPSASLQVDQNSSTPIQDNTWHHIAVVYKAGVEVIFYLDGNEIGRTYLTNFFEPETFLGTHWNIGHLANSDRLTPVYSFNGSLDDVRIYRRALSSAEVNAIKNQSSSNSLMEESDKKTNRISNDIRMWPNPATNKLNIDLGAVVSNVKIKILDLSGTEVINRNFENLNDSQLHIDVQQLAYGYYFVQIETDGQLATKKLIISK